MRHPGARAAAPIKDGFAKILENLFDDAVIDADADAGNETAAPDRFAVCVAGRNELDEATAIRFASLLRARGRAAYRLPAESPFSVGPHGVSLRDAEIVCLALVSTSSAARTRHIVRRLRRRAPHARVVVGFWGCGRARR
jgi:hypothetical protein